MEVGLAEAMHWGRIAGSHPKQPRIVSFARVPATASIGPLSSFLTPADPEPSIKSHDVSI